MALLFYLRLKQTIGLNSLFYISFVVLVHLDDHMVTLVFDHLQIPFMANVPVVKASSDHHLIGLYMIGTLIVNG